MIFPGREKGEGIRTGESLRNVGSGPSTTRRRSGRPGAVRFRKRRRPCGQPAAVGEIGRFRPLPPQAGHFCRIKATPSDLPFKSTGFAMYPLPPQVGQSSGSTPLSPSVFHYSRRVNGECSNLSFRVTNCEQGHVRSIEESKKMRWKGRICGMPSAYKTNSPPSVYCQS